MHRKLDSWASDRVESGRRQAGTAITRACRAWLRHLEPQSAASVRVRAPGKPLLGATCSPAEAAAAATVAVVGTVAAPPLSTRAGPHSLRQGPRAANHSGARSEAPPLPGTSATSEEGSEVQTLKARTRGLPSSPPSKGALFWVLQRLWPTLPSALLLKIKAGLPLLYSQKIHFTTPQCTRGRRQEGSGWSCERRSANLMRAIPYHQLAMCFSENHFLVGMKPIFSLGRFWRMKKPTITILSAFSTFPRPAVTGACCSNHLT